MTNNVRIITITAVFLLLLAGCADAAGSSGENNIVKTNVYFCRLVPDNSAYTLEPLLTNYLGENDYGRPTFHAITGHLETGDYALVQDTEDGVKYIQVLHIEAKGEDVEDLAVLTIELRKEDLPVPIEIYSQADEAAAATTTAPATSGLPATTQKSPLSAGLPVLAVLAGTGYLLASGRRE